MKDKKSKKAEKVPDKKVDKKKKPADKKPVGKKDGGDVVKVDKDKVDASAEKIKSKSKKRAEKRENEEKKWQLGDPVEVQNLISTLAQSSLQVKLEVGAWRGTSSDKEIASVLAGQLNGNVEGFSVSLKYLPPDIRKELNAKLGKLSKWVKSNSIPFGSGWHLIASALYDPLKKAVESSRIEVRDYLIQITKPEPYKRIHNYAKQVLGTAYREDRIPPPDEIRSMFTVNLKQEAVSIPTKLESIDSDSMEELRQEMIESYSQRYQSGIMDLVDGLKETVEVLVTTLEGIQDRDKYGTVLKMIESRIEDIIRLDIFESKRVRRALTTINDEVLNPLRENLFVLKKKEKEGKRKEIAQKAKKAIDVLDDVCLKK